VISQEVGLCCDQAYPPVGGVLEDAGERRDLSAVVADECDVSLVIEHLANRLLLLLTRGVPDMQIGGPGRIGALENPGDPVERTWASFSLTKH
jgi:hypothetical protein